MDGGVRVFGVFAGVRSNPALSHRGACRLFALSLGLFLFVIGERREAVARGDIGGEGGEDCGGGVVVAPLLKELYGFLVARRDRRGLSGPLVSNRGPWRGASGVRTLIPRCAGGVVARVPIIVSCDCGRVPS